MPLPSEPAIHLLRASCLMAQWREVVVVLWREKSTSQELRELIARERSVLSSTPEARLVAITLIELSSVTIPSEDDRALLTRHSREREDRIKGEAVVLPGGLVAATIRSLIAGITLASRKPYPYKVVASVDQAALFAAPLLEPEARNPISAERLSAWIESTRTMKP